jgi:hypothetical protein
VFCCALGENVQSDSSGSLRGGGGLGKHLAICGECAVKDGECAVKDSDRAVIVR